MRLSEAVYSEVEGFITHLVRYLVFESAWSFAGWQESANVGFPATKRIGVGTKEGSRTSLS